MTGCGLRAPGHGEGERAAVRVLPAIGKEGGLTVCVLPVPDRRAG